MNAFYGRLASESESKEGTSTIGTSKAAFIPRQIELRRGPSPMGGHFRTYSLLHSCICRVMGLTRSLWIESTRDSIGVMLQNIGVGSQTVSDNSLRGYVSNIPRS